MRFLLIATFWFLQTADQELTRLEEWSKTQPDTGPGKMAIGDEYFKVGRKFPKDHMKFMDKANEYWGKAWGDLDPVWKMKAKENLKKVYFISGASKPTATGWKLDKATVSGERVHSGQFAARLAFKKEPGIGSTLPLIWKCDLPRGTKEVTVSAWVLTDGTDSGDDRIAANLYTVKGELLQSKAIVPLDFPVWNEISCTVKAEGAIRMTLAFEAWSKAGIAYVDDISIKADGKELCENPGFEK